MHDNTPLGEPPEEPFDWEPPEDMFGDMPAGHNPIYHTPSQAAGPVVDTYDSLAAHAHHTVITCLAAHSGKTGSELSDMTNDILLTDIVKDLVDEHVWSTWQRGREILDSMYADFPCETVDFTVIPDLDVASRDVQQFFADINTRVNSPAPLPTNPTAMWASVGNRIRRFQCREDAQKLITAIDTGAPDVDLISKIGSITAPATANRIHDAVFTATAREWEANYRVARATTPDLRYSFGIPSLDLNMTARNGDSTFSEPLGSIAPGEFTVIAAATGNGKSTFARPAAASLAQDLRNWNRPNDVVLVGITEENPEIVLKAAKLGSGQSMHHMADNVIIGNWGSSRARVIESVWSLVINAYERSRETNTPITECGLPAVIIWDYIGGTVESGEDPDNTAMMRNANLAMRGLCGWDIHAMESFSGQSFKEYAGMGWPKGMEYFRPSVVAFAQFRKLDDPTWYDPNNKACHLSDFVLDNADGSPAWDVQPGDFRVPKQSEVRGSGVLINHATTLMVLHRSRPQNNPKITVDGRVRLSDTRARFILLKTRNGANSPIIEVSFDSQPSGLRGQFFDPKEVSWVQSGKISPAEGYNGLGDPILPTRKVAKRQLVAY